MCNLPKCAVTRLRHILVTAHFGKRNLLPKCADRAPMPDGVFCYQNVQVNRDVPAHFGQYAHFGNMAVIME